MEWFLETWRFIQEDKSDHYRILFMLAPMSRTPQDKRSGQALQSYAKKLEQMVEDMAPWRKSASTRNRRHRGKVKPGEIVVMLGAGEDPTDPLFSDAKVTRE